MNDNEMKEALQILAAAGPPVNPGINIKGSLVVKCACGRIVQQVDPEFFKFLDDGVLKYQSNVCPGCKEGERLDREMARFVCVKCKRVWHRIPPATDKTGFSYEAGRSYHTSGCPYCKVDDNEVSAKIIEKVLYDRRRKNGV